MKSQSSIEFLSVAGMGIVVTVVFMFVFSELIGQNQDEEMRTSFEDYSYYIQNEFIMASTSREGYSRFITVPYELNHYEFDIMNTQEFLILNYSMGDIVLRIPITHGNITKGINRFQNINGTTCVNC